MWNRSRTVCFVFLSFLSAFLFSFCFTHSFTGALTHGRTNASGKKNVISEKGQISTSSKMKIILHEGVVRHVCLSVHSQKRILFFWKDKLWDVLYYPWAQCLSMIFKKQVYFSRKIQKVLRVLNNHINNKEMFSRRQIQTHDGICWVNLA